MVTKNKLEEKIKYAPLVKIGIVLIGIIAGAFGAYMTDRYQIQYNKEKIRQNSQQISTIKAEMRTQSEKQNGVSQQILIEVSAIKAELKHLTKK